MDLAETRQLESMNRLSTHVLHDIKNHVSGLSLVVENARRHLSNPEFQRDMLATVEHVVGRMNQLMQQLRESNQLDMRIERAGQEINLSVAIP